MKKGRRRNELETGCDLRLGGGDENNSASDSEFDGAINPFA